MNNQERIDELETLVASLHEAALSAAEGNASAGKWIADRIRQEAGFNIPPDGTTQLLNSRRAPDYWSHG